MCVKMKEVHWSFRKFVCRCYGCVCRIYLFFDCARLFGMCVCVCVCVDVAEGKKGSGQLGCVPVVVMISQQLLGG